MNRRAFLQLGTAGAAGLLIGCSIRSGEIATLGQGAVDDGNEMAWLHVTEDGTIHFVVPAAEMGQGVQTALTMLVAEEMDADWSAITTRLAPYDPAFNNPQYSIQLTGGSSSVAAFWDKLRELGAAARQMMVEAAASRLDAPTGEFTTSESTVTHVGGDSFTYGELAREAGKLPPPSNPRLKSPAEFKLIGKSLPRVDTPDKVSGKPIYGIDITLPDMLYAAVAQVPVFGGQVTSYDEDTALAMPGVEAVVPISNGVAVVADSYWQAQKGLAALSIVFDGGGNERQNSAEFSARMRASVARMNTPQADESGQLLDLEYEAPFLAHQPLEPMNCTAHVTPTSCRIWVPTQNHHAAAIAASNVTGIPRNRIEITTTHIGGGFGRRLEIDYVHQAVTIAKAVGKPVQMVWSREEDMQHDFYRPAKCARFRIALDKDGYPTDWRVKLASPSSFQRTLDASLPELSWLPVADIIGDVSIMAGLDKSFKQSNPFPYQVGRLESDYEIMDFHVPVGSHRSVQHSFSGFCKEAAIDECAHAAGQDPLMYRHSLLKDEPRYTAVMDLAAKKAGWGKAPAGRFHGLAVHRSFKTYVAEIAEISIENGTDLKIHKIVCAVDCGLVVNPAIAESQVQGGVLWGLESAFYGEITIEDGRVAQSNFDDYALLYLSEAPPVEVYFVDSSEDPTGLGEPSTPPVAAALTNAIFAATGRRIRKLPITNHGFTI